MSRSEVDELIDTSAFRDWMKHHPDAAKRWLDQAVDNHLLDATNPAYKSFVQAYWTQQAYDAAGIDPATWDTTKGANANSDTITKVYEYDGQPSLDHLDLQWAGMANMIGPSFDGGFYDLDMPRTIAPGVQNGTGRIPDLPGGADDDVKKMIGQVAGMGEAGLITPTTQQAWRDIASGDPDRVSAGNTELLQREQLRRGVPRDHLVGAHTGPRRAGYAPVRRPGRGRHPLTATSPTPTSGGRSSPPTSTGASATPG